MTPTLAHRTDHAIQLRRELGTAELVPEQVKASARTSSRSVSSLSRCTRRASASPTANFIPGLQPDTGSNCSGLEIYVKLGMALMDAILAAMRNAAQAIKSGDDLGMVKQVSSPTSSR